MARRGGAAPSAEEQRVAALRQVAARTGNLTCLECAQRGPTYVDVTLGAFVCSRCSGLLRGLAPPHRVKSISMATFTAEEISLIKSRGNDYCKGIWLGLYEGEPPVLKDEQSLKDFMSDKYEKKRYYLEVNANEKPITVKETPVTQNNTVRDNGIWNSTTTSRPTVKMSFPSLLSNNISIDLATPEEPTHVLYDFSSRSIITGNEGLSFTPNGTTVSRPTPTKSFSPIVNPPPTNTAKNEPYDYSKFPVDFSNADIFNSSQLNNNFAAAPSQNMENSFANFNANNTNTVTQDRYAALADLDLTLRQQSQHQNNVSDNNVKLTPNFNPFQGNVNSNESRNPFRPNQQNVNGNSQYYSNPFIMGPNTASSGQSKNPFL